MSLGGYTLDDQPPVALGAVLAVRDDRFAAALDAVALGGAGEALLAVAAAELGAAAPEMAAVKQAVAQGDLQRAAVLMLASPRLLWA